jgi:hypothetical protein
LDTNYGKVDYAREFRGIVRCAATLQALLSFLSREPSGISISFPRFVHPSYLTKMSMSGNFPANRTPSALATNVAGEGSFRDAAMDPRFLESLKRSRLSMCETWLDTTLRKGPVSAAGANQQEFDPPASNAIADGRHLFTPAKFSKLGE